MILESGTKVLLVHRRLFDGDNGRYFVGSVDGYEDGVAKVTGYTWVRDSYSGTYKRKPSPRTKIFALASGTLIVYELDVEAEVEELRVEAERNGDVILTDGATTVLDLDENIARGPRHASMSHEG